MFSYPNSVIATTNLDRQGERFTREQLELLVKNFPGKIPLNVEHDLSKPPIGYVKNLRLVPFGKGFRVLGDIYSETELPEGQGISISAKETGNIPTDTDVIVYLPWPSYNDSELWAQIEKQNGLAVGRLQKKGIPSSTLGFVTVDSALIVATALFFIAPEWQIQYEKQVRPQIVKGVRTIKAILAKRYIVSDILLTFRESDGNKIELLLIPGKKYSDAGLEQGVIDKAVSSAVEYSVKNINSQIKKMRSVYYPERDCYEIVTVEHTDGNVIHVVP
ncbi:MAG: hypothetical protein ACI87Q_000843 [Pseudohongiellaceae bacterium]|jgi:hypothetical protein